MTLRDTLSRPDDEETPLLQRTKPSPTPLPWSQLSILIFLQLMEPLASQLINPFSPQLIREIGITGGDETKVGYYVGMLQSSFFAAQAITVLHWSSLSDRIGRKPVLLAGLCGTAISMLSFGFSKTYIGLIASRCLLGAFNGNIGVMKSMMADITDPTNVAAAFSFLPVAWSAGSTITPVLGASLAHPFERFPGLFFGCFEFLKTYPYLLACSIPAIYAIASALVTALSLRETIFTSYYINKLLYRSAHERILSKSNEGYKKPSSEPGSLRDVLTPRVLTATVNFALLSLVDFSIRAIGPVFYSSPTHLGGLAFSPQYIGVCLSLSNFSNGLIQVLYFAKLHNRFGTRNLYLACLYSGLITVALFPCMSLLTMRYGTVTPLVWGVLVAQLSSRIMLNMAFCCIFIYVSASPPTRRSIGAANGIAQVTVSMMRTVGPWMINSLYSLSVDRRYLGGWMVWWALMMLLVTTIIGGFMLPKKVWKWEDDE